MLAVFRPETTHLRRPEPTLAQSTDFPAALAAEPAATVTLVKSLVEKTKVHSTARTAAPFPLNVSGSVTLAPRATDPDDKVKLAVCP
jgi:hypothetical protein